MIEQKTSSKEVLEKLNNLPFRILISFKKIFEYWDKAAMDPNSPVHEQAKKVLDAVAHAPFLREPIKDYTILNGYKEEVKWILSELFPVSLTDNEIKAVSLPFLPVFFNPSRRFSKILNQAGDEFDFMVRDFDLDDVYRVAAAFYLSMRYGAQFNHKKSIYFDIPDKSNNTIRHYRAFFNADFSDFSENENEKILTEEEVQLLLDNYDDIDLWKKIIPPQSYDFVGFALVTLFDVTREQSLSELKDKLLKKDVLHSAESVTELELNIKSYLNLTDFQMGLAAYDHTAKKVSSLGTTSWSSLLLEEHEDMERRQIFCNYSVDQIFRHKEKFIVSRFSPDLIEKSPLLAKLNLKGVKSVIIAPLIYGEEVLGYLELTSKVEGHLNSMAAEQLKELLPLLTVAMKRTLDDHETSLEAIVQEQFTSIHSSVSWRFFDAAEKILQAKRHNKTIVPDPIVFKDVVPLFGQFDIRGSSQARNDAIQADLVAQLKLAEKVFEVANKMDKKPIYGHLLYRVKMLKDNLNDEINAGDEVKILEFLNEEIYPVFNYLDTTDENLKEVISKYNNALDPDLKVVYKKRKAYEETVTILNDQISEYLERQESLAQQMYPHYFEKYKTDGVEYNIYIGESLMQAREYNPIHLQNLRLWQLLVTCGVENLVRRIEPSLKVDLKIASLILAHNNPLAIKFRMDEKQFDVDGAYNIRYEIMKKRIDKAYVKGTDERLTQPGKLAIVYSQDSEAEEYRRYIEYLQSIGYIAAGIEDLSLQDLQGTVGLKALRVNFLYDDSEDAQIEALMQASVLN